MVVCEEVVGVLFVYGELADAVGEVETCDPRGKGVRLWGRYVLKDFWVVVDEGLNGGEDDVGDEGVCADGAGIPEAAVADGVGVAEGVGADVVGHAEEDGDVFVGVEAVGDEEGDDDDVGLGGDGWPVFDVWGFFHEGGVDFGVDVFLADDVGLSVDDLCGVFVEAGAVSYDE